MPFVCNWICHDHHSIMFITIITVFVWWHQQPLWTTFWTYTFGACMPITLLQQKNTVSITILRDHAHFTSPPMSQFHIHPYINSILQNMFFCSLNPHPNKKKIKSFPTNKRKCFLPRSIKCYRQHYSHPYLPYSPIFAKKMKNTSTVLIDVLNLAV